ncbi:hypothetical protein Salat_1143200 [Sesamum alatum]|uniref:Uncharacterized protein n=1 Tax=Sesamum alatum TaxID=300844 RepID=A0AAE2CN98_9LAMI|nr:hypothetical protein Salat_1143200 [Sesamum alatum]
MEESMVDLGRALEWAEKENENVVILKEVWGPDKDYRLTLVGRVLTKWSYNFEALKDVLPKNDEPEKRDDYVKDRGREIHLGVFPPSYETSITNWGGISDQVNICKASKLLFLVALWATNPNIVIRNTQKGLRIPARTCPSGHSSTNLLAKALTALN